VRSLIAAAFLLAAALLPGQGSASDTVGVDERLGGQVAMEAHFTAEDGTAVRLGDLVSTPTVLALVYYRCPSVCSTLIMGLSGVLKSFTDTAGKDFHVVTVSIDDTETPADARHSRGVALESIEAPFPPGAWRFLTGDRENIRALADSIGFRFARRGDVFDHPVGLVILSPRGTIVRYMYGADFLPADLSMSILEASHGTVRPTIARVLRICFSYDPQSHHYVFRTLQVSAVVIGLIVGGFAAYLIVSGARRRRVRTR
jgi:protein SCO1